MITSMNDMMMTTTQNGENVDGWIDGKNDINKSVNDEGSSHILPNQFLACDVDIFSKHHWFLDNSSIGDL